MTTGEAIAILANMLLEVSEKDQKSALIMAIQALAQPKVAEVSVPTVWTGPYRTIPYEYTYTQVGGSCENCSNNPKNGGSGICHCTLGSPGVIS